MNMQTYKADKAWKRGIPGIFFKILIQLYLLHSFRYYLTFCIKEAIDGKIFWRLNERVLAYVAATAWNRGIPYNFTKHWSNCIIYIYLSIFDLLYQRGYQSQYLWKLNLKVLAYEAATAWNRGIPSKILNFPIRSYFFCFLIYCST